MTHASALDVPNTTTDPGENAFGELLFADHDAGGTRRDFENEDFQLRGHEPNRLIDAATPLLGLVIRVRRLAEFRDVERLYQQVADEVTAIDRELVEQGYERPTVVAYRYVLCAFIDEAVLGTDWGAQSVWSQHSLLSRFHNETWGGEKVFAILARMKKEPERYSAMLGFIYLCLCLGFEGRYKVMENGRDEYQQIVRGLYDQLRELRGNREPRPVSDATANVVPARNRLRTGLPFWLTGGLFAVAMVAIYQLYNMALNERIRDVLSVLDQLPQ
ncbi:MAG TPA: type IVB secretion system protein IcmH/DotU [Marinobacter sp.]|nr:type IVB secretion system protein IcmH/DotU [Marinobacter sp.]